LRDERGRGREGNIEETKGKVGKASRKGGRGGREKEREEPGRVLSGVRKKIEPLRQENNGEQRS
jgi:hypothetical protein